MLFPAGLGSILMATIVYHAGDFQSFSMTRIASVSCYVCGKMRTLKSFHENFSDLFLIPSQFLSGLSEQRGMLERFFPGVAPACERCGSPTAPVPTDDRPELYWFDNLRQLFDLAGSIGSDGHGSPCVENVRTNMVECDLRQFLNIRPENITIDVDGHNVSLRAQQEDRSEDGKSSSTHMVSSL